MAYKQSDQEESNYDVLQEVFFDTLPVIGCVYEAFCIISNKSYIGITTKSLRERRKRHEDDAKRLSSLPFHKAIRKHGKDSFIWRVVAQSNEKDRLFALEKDLIAYSRPDCYNVSDGGEASALGIRHSKETKELCGAYAKVRWAGRRAVDLYPKECFLCPTAKEAFVKYGIPKTTWHRVIKKSL